MKPKLITILLCVVAMPTAVLSDGAAVYNKACVACHAAGVANAPKLGDKAAWTPRLSAGVDALVGSVTNGKGAMPPRGACGDCSDADLKAAVDYMVSQSQ